MGIVSSCLASLCGRGDDVEDRAETSRLLPEDAYRAGYGSVQRATYQPDPESSRREREALEGICHSMSDSVEDLFTKTHMNGKTLLAQQEEVARPQTPELDQGTEDMAMRTIRKGRIGPIYNGLGKRPEGWRAVQDAIG